jgi:hypothetical protein
MNIYYCEVCGVRISNAELDRADTGTGELHYCSKCTPKAVAQTQPKQATPSKTPSTMRKQTLIAIAAPTKTQSKPTLKPLATATIGVLCILGALFIINKGAKPNVDNKKSVVAKDETVVLDPKTTTPPLIQLEKGTDAKRSIAPIGTITQTKNQSASQEAREILFEENFSKFSENYTGERVQMDSEFVLKMQRHGQTRRFKIDILPTSLLIPRNTSISFRINPSSGSSIRLYCCTESKKSYVAIFKVTPGVWTTHSMALSKMEDGESKHFVGDEKLTELRFIIYDMESDAYLDDIVISDNSTAK